MYIIFWSLGLLNLISGDIKRQGFSLLYFYCLHCYKCLHFPLHFAHLTSALASPALWRQFLFTDFFRIWDTLYYFLAYLAMFCWKLDLIDDIMIVTLGTDILPLKVTIVVCLFSDSFQGNLRNLPPSLCVAMMSLMKLKKKKLLLLFFYF